MEIEKRSSSIKDKPLLNLGIGDATQPVAPAILEAMQKALSELGDQETFRGYGPSEGYPFIREAISQHEYEGNISPDEIFLSNGAKSDAANLQEIFAPDSKIALSDPAYPVYVDSTVLSGKTGLASEEGTYSGIHYLPCLEENGFLPKFPNEKVDVIYLCSPNNPTGVAFSKEELKKWVDFALEMEAVILFDGAYESFITSDAPRSIYEVENAKKVAIELRSFSKKAGFTGLRCSYIVIPKELHVAGQPLSPLWERRIHTKFGGVSYPIQRGAEAIYSERGKKEVSKQIAIYQKQTSFLRKSLQECGFTVFGGIDAPYIFCKTPRNLSSWEFFEELLQKTGIISVPGRGFGPSGEGYVRFSAFAKIKVIEKAVQQLQENILCATR